MRRLTVLTALITLGLLAAGLSAWRQPAAPRVIEVDKLADNLYVLRGGGGNTAAFVTEAGVVIVDTKLPGWGQALLEAVRTFTDKPVTTVINTHTHYDHTNGQVEFPPTVAIIAHENTKTYMEQSNPVYGLQSGPQPNPFRDAGGRGYPTRTFTDTLTVGSGADRIDIHHFGRAHTGGDAFIVFPAHRVMHAGDVFPSKALPIMDINNGGSGLAYPDTLDKAAALDGVETVITGHASTTMTMEDLEEYAGFIRDFVARARVARQAGESLDSFVQAYDTPLTYNGYATPNRDRVRANAEVIWQETP